MPEQTEDPPHVRAQSRLLGLLRNTESVSWDQGSFNPWAMAFFESLLDEFGTTPGYVENGGMDEWIRQHDLYQDAERAWNGALLRRPFMQLTAAAHCLGLRAAIEGGDGVAVLEAVAKCATHGLVMPGWLAAAFVERFQRVMSGACNGWGATAAFGSVIPKGKNLAGVRALARDAPLAYEVAINLLEKNPKQAVHVSLYENVGETIQKSATQVQNLVKSYIKQGNGIHPPLKYIRARLLKGESLTEVFAAWSEQGVDEGLNSIGFRQDSVGTWRRINRKNLKKK